MTIRDSFQICDHQVCSDYPARNLQAAMEPLVSEQFVKARVRKPWYKEPKTYAQASHMGRYLAQKHSDALKKK